MTTATLNQDALRLIADGRSVAGPAAREDDTAALVAAARDGDRAAFGQLYLRYARMVHGILIARVPRGEVDDLVQDVFLQAIRQIGTLRDTLAFGGWLATIARNRGSDHLRQARPAEALSEDVDLKVDGGSDASVSLEATVVLQALRALPDAYRETLALRLIEGMTGPEIAAATGLTPASVRVNLHRGMKQLRERLEGGSARER